MVLVVDVGNTNIVLGVFDEDKLIGPWRMTTGTKRTSDEYGTFICALLERNNIRIDELEHVIIASVVPNIMYSLENGFKKYFNINPMIVAPGIKTGISIRTDNPKEVGADRIVDIVAGYYIYGGPAIVIDFGTATTYDVVTEDGLFCAAITSPGIGISADALWNRAAQLPNIKIKKPDSILATNTITSMQAGLVYGYIGQVEYIVNKIKEEMGIPNMKVVATGGLARIISSETDVIDIYDPQLTLKGLKLIYDKNKKVRN
ncbi:type III pantothenate kinase [Vallitalea okinawensis]|uniref:type III pantothenate kinase n=1 Tax=Vallitalea okinawensis TaxID=2078660 RepID=UPI000CFCA468|nr:type III pantothenate kinase [Vallitalea okinawensis]